MIVTHDFFNRIQQFENFENYLNFVCFLNRTFYDFKQSFREWYDCLKKYLIFIDYIFLIIDQCIFIHKNDIILSIHVDDIFIIELQIKKINVFKVFFVKRFRIKNLKKVSFYLNVKIIKNRKNKTIWFTQIIFIDQFIENCDLKNCRFFKIFMQSMKYQKNMHNELMYNVLIEKKEIYLTILKSLQ